MSASAPIDATPAVVGFSAESSDVVGSVGSRLRSWLDVPPGSAGSTEPSAVAVTRDDLALIRSDLEAAAVRAVELLGGHGDTVALPLRFPKGRVVALGSCERHAVATARESATADAGAGELSPRMLAGRALDVFVELEIAEGPVADPLEDLLSWLDACGDLDVRDQVIVAADQLPLAPLASAARAWAGLDPRWWPRTQAAAAVHLAGGAVRCDGRTDVELGGVLSGRPTVVVEVKLGRPHQTHLDEVTHYALLVALRDGVAPAAVARWYPGGAFAEMAVTAGVLHTAARRLTDAIGAWVELQVGRPPIERPGALCSWCPDAGTCPSFQPARDPYDDFGDGDHR